MIAGLRRHAFAADALIGLLVAVSDIALVLNSDVRHGPVWANVVALTAFGAVLAARQRFPVPAAFGFLVLGAVMGTALTPPPRNPLIFAGLLLFSYSAGSGRSRVLVFAFMPALVATVVGVDLALAHPNVGDFIFPTALSLAAYGAGRNALYRAALAAELHEASLRAEEAEVAAEALAAATERRRIAREMHDVVAHSISVMVVQAGGARRILERDPERAVEAAAAIETTGRETLIEMRRLLGVMNPASSVPPATPSASPCTMPTP